MSFSFKKAVLLGLVALIAAAGVSRAQGTSSDGTPIQRVSVMSDKLDRMRRSLSSVISVLRQENDVKKDDEKNIATPIGRLTALQKDISRVSSDVSSLRGKLDRGEKYERSEVDSLETTVAELQTRVDTAQTETAALRAATTTSGGDTSKAKGDKKGGKFLGIFGGGHKDEYADLIGSVAPGRDRELFVTATKEVRKGNYDTGRLLFQTIITTYPDSPYLPMSKLAIADSFYLEGDTTGLTQAISSYNDWLTFFPMHPLADRVTLKIAESEMRQVGLPDRDATHARRAEVRLKALMANYPNSFLKPDAQTRLSEVQNNLGMHSMDVANYYYSLSVQQKKGGLKGAQSRYREVIDKYPNFCATDQVLFKLANTYLIEEETDQAARYFQQIVSDFPNSEFVEKAKEQLGIIGATVPEAKPERKEIQPCPATQAGFLGNLKNEFFGTYPMTIDKNGVLMTKDFSKERFELIDQIIENQGDITANQIPKALTTVIRDDRPTQALKTPNVNQVPNAVTDTPPPVKKPNQ
jgi:outer membrane assembly lipoprotein YfiO